MNKLFAAIIAAVFATASVAPAFAAEAKKEEKQVQKKDGSGEKAPVQKKEEKKDGSGKK